MSFFPVQAKGAKAKSVYPLEISLEHVALRTEPVKTVEIVIVESDYEKAQREKREKEELERRAWVQSGTDYGDVKLLYKDNTNNCVLWFKKQTGISRSLGAGGRAGIQGKEPKVGSGGVMKGSPHLALVKEIKGDTILINESNYRKGWITEREIPLTMFLGFIYN